MQLAVGDGLQIAEVVGDGRIDHLPGEAFVVEGRGLNVLFGRMDERLADVGQVVGRQDRFLAAGQIDLRQRARVASAAVGEKHVLVGLVETGERRGERVGGGDLSKLAPASFAVGLKKLAAAVGRHLHGEANAEVVVGDVAGEPRVLFDQLALAGGDIDAIEIVKLRIAIVDADEDFVAETFR